MQQILGGAYARKQARRLAGKSPSNRAGEAKLAGFYKGQMGCDATLGEMSKLGFPFRLLPTGAAACGT